MLLVALRTGTLERGHRVEIVEWLADMFPVGIMVAGMHGFV